MTKIVTSHGRLTGQYANPHPVSYSQIQHPVLGIVGSRTFSRNPEAGTAVISLGGMLEIEGPEVLFVPGRDQIGQPFLDAAAAQAALESPVIEGEVAT
jgi:hypothetical protein